MAGIQIEPSLLRQIDGVFRQELLGEISRRIWGDKSAILEAK